jgi:hypothetical protein
MTLKYGLNRKIAGFKRFITKDSKQNFLVCWYDKESLTALKYKLTKA